MRRSEDVLLGRLAVREKVCSQEQVDECLQIQSMTRSDAPLGDLLLYKGYLTEHQLRELLSRQRKKVMACLGCRLSFTVITLSDGKTARCPRCKNPLEDVGDESFLRTDAEVSTGNVPTVEPPGGREEGVSCVICDHAFRAARDASGRVRCPSCRSSFSPE